MDLFFVLAFYFAESVLIYLFGMTLCGVKGESVASNSRKRNYTDQSSSIEENDYSPYSAAYCIFAGIYHRDLSGIQEKTSAFLNGCGTGFDCVCRYRKYILYATYGYNT
jgi:hypothetical protein